MGNSRAKASKIITTVTTYTKQGGNQQSGVVVTVESCPHPPLSLLPLALASFTEPLTTLVEIRTGASQAPSTLATDKQTAVRHLPRVRRQHCRGTKTFISQDCRVPSSFSTQRRLASTTASPAAFSPSMLSRVPSRRSNTATSASSSSPWAPAPPVKTFQGAVPVTGA